MMNSFENKVKKLVANWEEIYRKEVRMYNYDPIGEYIDPEVLSKYELEEAERRAEKLLDEQIRFITSIVAYKILDGETHKNLSNIKRFLSYQHYEEELFPRKHEPAYHLVFWGGCSSGVNIRVEELSEFDFADTWTSEDYEIVCIYSHKWKGKGTINKKIVNDLKEIIRKDFEHDHYKVCITIPTGSQSRRHRGICFKLIVNE